MISSFYNAKSGAIANDKAINVISNNFANLNTVGFKGDRMSFSDALYTNMNTDAATATNLRNGNGTRNQQVSILFEQGSLENTGYPLDFAIQGEGYFAVEDPDGDPRYTRDGHFQLSDFDGSFYLADAEGNRVLDQELNYIVMDEMEDLSKVNKQDLNLGVFNFPNEYALIKDGQNKFLATLASQDAVPGNNQLIKQSYLEGSNVDTANEMTKVIEVQRAFQFNSRIIQLSDELEQTINNLR